MSKAGEGDYAHFSEKGAVVHAQVAQEEPVEVQAVASTVLIRTVEPPPRTGCSHACALVFGVIAFGTSTSGLIWPMFWKAVAAVFGVSMLLTVYGLFLSVRTTWAYRPLYLLSFVLAGLFALAGILTYADYDAKCTDRKDLGDRPLQNAFYFDCELGILFIVLWTIGLVVSVIAFVLVGLFAVQLVIALDGYQQRLGNADARARRRGNVIAAVFVIIAVSTMLAASFGGHKTGTVDGVCPKGEDFFDKPRYNDLGCCLWTAKHGTCCKQTACTSKSNPWIHFDNGTAATTECDDLTGLLSCSICHTDSGTFASSITDITVCQSFCDQLFRHCCYSDCNDPVAFCESTYKVKVVQDGTRECFSSAPNRAVVLPLLVAALLWAARA